MDTLFVFALNRLAILLLITIDIQSRPIRNYEEVPVWPLEENYASVVIGPDSSWNSILVSVFLHSNLRVPSGVQLSGPSLITLPESSGPQPISSDK